MAKRKSKPAKQPAAPAAARAISHRRKARLRAPTAAPPSIVKQFSRRVLDTPLQALNALPPVSAVHLEHHAPEAGCAANVDRGLPIPESYGLDRLVALARDPLWIFCYWELCGPKLPELRRRHGQDLLDACAWVLRLYRLDENTAVDVEVQPAAGNWYLRAGSHGKYQAELALLSPEGEWFSLLVSQIIETPAQEPSGLAGDERLFAKNEEALAAALRKALARSSAWCASGFRRASRPQSQEPEETPGKTQQPHFKVKLPRRLKGVTAPSGEAWPHAE